MSHPWRQCGHLSNQVHRYGVSFCLCDGPEFAWGCFLLSAVFFTLFAFLLFLGDPGVFHFCNDPFGKNFCLRNVFFLHLSFIFLSGCLCSFQHPVVWFAVSAAPCGSRSFSFTWHPCRFIIKIIVPTVAGLVQPKAFTPETFYTKALDIRNPVGQTALHPEPLTKSLLHQKVLKLITKLLQENFCARSHLNHELFTPQTFTEPLHQKPLYTTNSYTTFFLHENFFTRSLLYQKPFAQQSFYITTKSHCSTKPFLHHKAFSPKAFCFAHPKGTKCVEAQVRT